MSVELAEQGVGPLADAVRQGTIRATRVVDETLAAIWKSQPSLNAFVYVDEASIREQAERIDDKQRRGESLGPLAGVPIAIKDAICTRGEPTTAGSRVLGGYVPPYDAEVITRLRAADAIICGKTNMDEFAMGSSNETSAYGPVKNPWATNRTPGGSSGGSAVAVAARLTPLALGSDTGGSIRQPAALTGVVGVKPTYGRVSRRGLIAFASSLDQVGPFATDVRSAARLLEVLAGKDPGDATSQWAQVDAYEPACDREPRGLRLGVPSEYFGPGLDAEVDSAVRSAIAALEREGCTVKPVSLPHTRFAVASYYVIATAEASSNLARFDGVRYGQRVMGDPKSTRPLQAMYDATRSQGFGREVKRRILLGTYVLSAGYYDAYYAKAWAAREHIRADFERAFRDVDAIVCPTTPTPAFELGEKANDPLSMYLSDVFTLPASLAGIPAMSVPCALSKSGLPMGLQLLAPHMRETTLFTLAAAWERVSPVRARRPPP